MSSCLTYRGPDQVANAALLTPLKPQRSRLYVNVRNGIFYTVPAFCEQYFVLPTRRPLNLLRKDLRLLPLEGRGVRCLSLLAIRQSLTESIDAV